MWSLSLPTDAAYKLLTKMNLLDVAISYACVEGQYEFALEVCRLANRPADDVHLKIANDYEDDGKFNEAEVEFLKANKPKEAIEMYIHARDWRSALRIAESHLPAAINEVLLRQADDALESRNFTDYEALLIRADRTDIIMQRYKEMEMWDDALRIAEEYSPNSINAIRAQQNRSNSTSGLSNDSRKLLQEASEFARDEEFRKAIDCLIRIGDTKADVQVIEQALLRATEMCQFLDGSDRIEVAKDLAPRLVTVNQVPRAAQLYLAADLPKEAVDVFIQTDNWSKARRLAKELNVELLQYVENQQKIRLRSEGNIEQLADIGKLKFDDYICSFAVIYQPKLITVFSLFMKM